MTENAKGNGANAPKLLRQSVDLMDPAWDSRKVTQTCIAFRYHYLYMIHTPQLYYEFYGYNV
jgi:hypothetical protein